MRWEIHRNKAAKYETCNVITTHPPCDMQHIHGTCDSVSSIYKWKKRVADCRSLVSLITIFFWRSQKFLGQNKVSVSQSQRWIDHCFQTPDKTDHWCYCYYSVFKLSLKEKVENCLSYTVTGKSIELHEDSLLWYHGENCWLFGLPPAVWSLKKIAIYLLWSAAEWVMAQCMCVHQKRCEEVKLRGWVCKKKKVFKD